MIDFLLVIHPAEEGGYWAEMPEAEGGFVQSETIDDVIADAPRAIASYIEALQAD